MDTIIFSPSKYIQGQNSLSNIGKYAKKNAFVIADSFVMSITKDIIEESFKKENLISVFELFNGECSKVEIDRLKQILEKNNSEIIIGVGGGKTLDTAKALAYYANLPVLITPTIASTDAPCSALSVLYTENGAFDEYLLLPSNPNIVLMDTEIIAKAPARLLASGMGDALATYFESNTYLSGIGFESGGLAAAHAIHNGLTILEECHEFYHGEKVAFGTLVQLFLENAPIEEIEEVLVFCKTIGLPTSLEELGIKSIEKEKLLEVAKLASAPGETIHNMPFDITPEKVLAAILAADNYGSY